jgi:hypothetical protein
MNAARLIRLYPKTWRARYGDELNQLVEDLAGAVPGRRLAVDIGRGALDAHWRGGFGMRRMLTDPAVRRGIYDGLIIAGLIAVNVFLTNVVWPAGPNESDSDPEYVIQDLAIFAAIALLLMVIGARARRRTTSVRAGARAGASAGIVIAVLGTLTFLVVNNIWLGIVSQQHDKRIAFAESGWTSMRAYLSVQQVEGLVILLPLLGVGGAVLGLLGALLFRRPRNPQHTS